MTEAEVKAKQSQLAKRMLIVAAVGISLSVSMMIIFQTNIIFTAPLLLTILALNLV